MFEWFYGSHATTFAVIEWANIATDSKNSRVEKFRKVDMRHSWLAMSVSSYKTHAVRQIDGYTLLLRPKGFSNSQGHGEEQFRPASEPGRGDADAVEQQHIPQIRDQPDEMDMDDIQPAHENKPVQDTLLHAGFCGYLCAEYSDSLT